MPKFLEPLVLPRASGYREAAYHAIKEGILSGYLAYGQPLIEEEIASQLNVSRTPVREALAILQHEGLISPRNGRGFHVRQLTREEFVTMFAANEVVEPYLVRLATLTATDMQLRAIQEAIEHGKAVAESGDLPRILRAGRDFHRAVGIAAGNAPLTQFVVNNEERTDLYLLSHEKILTMLKIVPFNQEHEMIFNAIMQHDSEAAVRLAIYHSQAVRERLSPFFNVDEFQKMVALQEVLKE
ncbi:GntR family transcriptional regulator [Dictyobacter sp. S3.2.2.5]|uniref:GntR family transcriptional regulator n=1 Tax=Dictyobacter halimunensis TaxID=3026934 RepID=A0ABQ6FN11_9CHLR|nr:GntR family transcriptional regulator [Dictyobacter sp. S3.2.2.5]